MVRATFMRTESVCVLLFFFFLIMQQIFSAIALWLFARADDDDGDDGDDDGYEIFLYLLTVDWSKSHWIKLLIWIQPWSVRMHQWYSLPSFYLVVFLWNYFQTFTSFRLPLSFFCRLRTQDEGKNHNFTGDGKLNVWNPIDFKPNQNRFWMI